MKATKTIGILSIIAGIIMIVAGAITYGTVASQLKAENDRRRAAGEPEKLPEENYYGWLVNDKLTELKALF